MNENRDCYEKKNDYFLPVHCFTDSIFKNYKSSVSYSDPFKISDKAKKKAGSGTGFGSVFRF